MTNEYPTELVSILEAIADRAARLCKSQDARIFVLEGDVLRYVAGFGDVPLHEPVRPLTRGMVTGRAVIDRAVVHVEDMAAAAEEDFPVGREIQRRTGYRTALGVPLVRDGKAIGAILMRRSEVRPFDSNDIELTRAFADQAAVAIENLRLSSDLKARNAELAEALEQQTATADILKVISSSPTDLQPVFDAILEGAARLCDSHLGTIGTYDGKMHQYVAVRAGNADVEKWVLERGPFRPHPGGFLSRVLENGEPVEIADLKDSIGYRDRRPLQTLLVEQTGVRTHLSVPMLKEGRAVGTISMYRSEVRPFTQKQIDLITTFANQAVIAIENVRLFKELQARNAEVTEALEQRIATAEILSVISRSQTDVQPVFDTIAKNALRLCNGNFSTVGRIDGSVIQLAALHNVLPEDAEKVRRAWPLSVDSETVTARTVRDCAVVQVRDVKDDARYQLGDLAGSLNYRSAVGVPMLRDGQPVGAIAITRSQPGEFPPEQVALLKAFADQAVIAIENVRLFKELQARNAEVTIALERQTATSEVLKIISRSTFDLEPVLKALVDNAARLCRANHGMLFRQDGDVYSLAASYNATPEYRHLMQTNPIVLGRESITGRAMLERQAVHVADVLADPDYQRSDAARLGNFRTVLGVPLLREGIPIGTMGMTRDRVEPFTDQEIALVTTFADQAVIAIENVRLFKELQARNAEVTAALEQQTATAEVLKVISRSTFDLESVLQTLTDNAAILCRAKRGMIFRRDGDVYRLAAPYNVTPELREYLQSHPVGPDRATVSGRSLMDKRPVHVHDVLADTEYQWGDAQRLGNYRTVLSVPLLREGEPMGTIALTRDAVEPFSEQEIALVTTFADQAGIAIENVRLFKEIQDKSRELEIANKHKSEFLANMSHELRTPLNSVIGFSDLLLERLYGDMNEKQENYIRNIQLSGKHLLSLINDILDLSKIEAGRMELDLADVHVPSALQNAMMLVRERAQRQGIALSCNVDPRVAAVPADERKFKQIMLNLLSNAVKYTPQGGRVDVVADLANGHLEVAVRDTGVGIAPEHQQAVFEQFRQVGRAGSGAQEGTGLGLALARRFAELHGGTIRLESAPGKGSTFTLSLPVQR